MATDRPGTPGPDANEDETTVRLLAEMRAIAYVVAGRDLRSGPKVREALRQIDSDPAVTAIMDAAVDAILIDTKPGKTINGDDHR